MRAVKDPDIWLWKVGRLYYMRRTCPSVSVCFKYGDSPTFTRMLGRLYLASG